MTHDTIRIGSGAVHLAARSGVCVVAYRGTMTTPLFLEAAYRAAQLIDAADCTAFYMGMDKTLIAMSDEDFRVALSMLGPASRARLKLPGAVVTCEIAAKLGQRYAWDAAQQGIERRAFTEPEKAWQWALQRAREVRFLRHEEQTRPGFVPSAHIAL